MQQRPYTSANFGARAQSAVVFLGLEFQRDTFRYEQHSPLGEAVLIC